VLDQQHAGPKEVDKALGPAKFFDVERKGGDAFVGDAKDFKEVEPKGFGLAVFVTGVCPGFAEKQCPDLISFQLRTIKYS